MPDISLRLCLDTAVVDHWRQWQTTGIFYGVTTNPLLLERAGITCTLDALKSLALTAFDLGFQEVQLQTWGSSVESLVNTGKHLADIDPRVVVKVPITQVGTEAASQLIQARVRVTLTGVYAVHQVMIAAALGAEYVAPYLGRINDLGRNGRDDLAQMQRVLDGVNSPTRILTASIRSPEDVSYLATQGLNTFTMSDAIAAQFFNVAATNAAAADFERAATMMGATVE